MESMPAELGNEDEALVLGLPSLTAIVRGSELRSLALKGEARSALSSASVGVQSSDVFCAGAATTCCVTAGAVFGAGAAGLGGAAVITKGLACLGGGAVAAGGGGMLGGIAHVGGVGGILGTGLIHMLVRNEQEKVYYSTMASSVVGAGVGSAVAVGAVLGASYAGTAGAAAVTSGLAVLGGAAGMAGGIVASGGIALGVAVAFGLIAFAIWWYMGETGKSDDPSGAKFFEALSNAVYIDVRTTHTEGLLMQPATLTDGSRELDFKRHIENILEDVFNSTALETPLDVETMCASGGIAILKESWRKLNEVAQDRPWYKFWRWGDGTRMKQALRLLTVQLLLAGAGSGEGMLATSEGEESATHHFALAEASQCLSEKGKGRFGVPFARMLCIASEGITEQIREHTNSQERDIALQFFELPATATDRQIKNAYRRLSLRMHPDRAHGHADVVELQQYLNSARDLLLHPARHAIDHVLMLTETEEQAQQAADDVAAQEHQEEDAIRHILGADIQADLTMFDWLQKIRVCLERFHGERIRARLRTEACQLIWAMRDQFEREMAEAASNAAPDAQRNFGIEGTVATPSDMRGNAEAAPSSGSSMAELTSWGSAEVLVSMENNEHSGQVAGAGATQMAIASGSAGTMNSQVVSHVELDEVAMPEARTGSSSASGALGGPIAVEQVEFRFKGPVCKDFIAERVFAELPMFDQFELSFSAQAPFSVWVAESLADEFHDMAKQTIVDQAPSGSRIRRQAAVVPLLSGVGSLPSTPPPLTP